MSVDGIDDLGIDRTDSTIQPSGMTLERALAIAVGAKMRSPGMTETQDRNAELVRDGVAEGLTDPQLVRKTGMTRWQIMGHRKRLGLEQNYARPNELDWNSGEGRAYAKQIDEMDRNGFPPRDIVARTGLAEGQVKFQLRLSRKRRAEKDKRRARRQAKRSADAA